MTKYYERKSIQWWFTEKNLESLFLSKLFELFQELLLELSG